MDYNNNMHFNKLFLLIILLLFPASIFAQSGCCSWHGGVCGCTSYGPKLCCDGTASPSCYCSNYSSPQRIYIPVYTPVYIPPPAPKFPQMTATHHFEPNYYQSFTLYMTLDDPSPSKYSAVINKCAGCDPGPLVDFNSPSFTFASITTGKWYVNVKKDINGVWSTVSYWTLEVPEWYPPPTPIPTPTLSTLQTMEYTIDHMGRTEKKFFYLSIIISISAIFCILIFRKH